ncbi:MAG: protein BatD [Pseudomonadales bacterium]|nr:protein BatD [Pseudomonadales bacterium]
MLLFLPLQKLKAHFRALLLVSCTLFLASISARLCAEVTVSIDRAEIYENESFTLSIQLDDTSYLGKGPNTDILLQDFELLGQSKNISSRSINGRSEKRTIWQLTLKAKQPGIITVPALTVSGEQSQPFTLTILPITEVTAGTNQADLDQDFFIETQISDKESFVQQQLELTIRFNTSRQLQNLSITPLDLDDVEIIELENKNFRREINGKTFLSYELKYMLFPQKSGELIIPASVVQAEVLEANQRRSLFSQGKPIRVRGQTLTVTVKPIPSTFADSDWLPAKRLQLSDSFNRPPDRMQVGDAITRNINIEATGLMYAQLPEVALNKLDGFSVYPEQKQQTPQQVMQAGNLIASKQQSFSLVATAAGNYTLPAITVKWFNTETQQAEIASLPAINITVSANPNLLPQQATPLDAAPAAPLTEPAESINKADTDASALSEPAGADTFKLTLFSFTPWLLTAIGLVIIVIQYRKIKRLQQLETTDKSATDSKLQDQEKLMSAFTQASHAKDFASARTALIRLADHQLPNKVSSLADIASICPEEYKGVLNALDAHLFQSAASPNQSQLIAIGEFLSQYKTQKKTSLQAFYPS